MAEPPTGSDGTTPPTQPKGAGDGRPPMTRAAITRWTIAVLLLATAAVLATVSALTPHLRVCEEVVAQVGDEAVAQTCRPLGLTEPVVVLAAALAVLVLLPDVRRVNIAGLFELERRLEEQEQETEELRGQVMQLRLDVRQSQTQHVTLSYLPPGATVALPSDAELDRKAEEIRDELD